MGFSCFNFLFHLDEDCNRLARHNYNFTVTQSVRLTCIVASMVVWGTLVYVWVKDVFAQLQFYVLVLWLVAICSVS